MNMQILDSEIHLWLIDQAVFSEDELRQECWEWLTKSEQKRYRRFYFDRHRKQLLLGRYLIRSVLSQYTECIAPAEWRFLENDYGKPFVDPDQNSNSLFFNLSHSGNRLVLAVARHEFIGVDIERSDKQRRVAKISDRFFSGEEVKDLLALDGDQQLNRFYELWTLKEAYIKACGLGLAIPLQQFSYSFPAVNKLAVSFDAVRGDDARDWQFWQIDLVSDYELALAARIESSASINSLSSWELSGLDEFHSLDIRVLRSN